MNRFGRFILGCALCCLMPSPVLAADFSFDPVGQLKPGSGEGRVDDQVYAPGIQFPLEGKAYANSQVYGAGGSQGPGGGQCKAENYGYPWQDNYCEIRRWNMPLCPAGTGHQGQDIRPQSCDDRTHWITAVTSGTITQVTGTSIQHQGDDGIRYRYLHGAGAVVSSGQRVVQGQRLTKVSNLQGGTPATTIHLHFDMFADGRYLPTYLSLIKAYEQRVERASVVRLYLAFLQRLPDAGGYAFWQEQLRTGMPLAAIGDAFAASEEFRARFGTPSNAEFVDLLYQNVLGRPADTPGRNFWISQLEAGASRGTIMVGFSESAEFVEKSRAQVAGFVF